MPALALRGIQPVPPLYRDPVYYPGNRSDAATCYAWQRRANAVRMRLRGRSSLLLCSDRRSYYQGNYSPEKFLQARLHSPPALFVLHQHYFYSRFNLWRIELACKPMGNRSAAHAASSGDPGFVTPKQPLLHFLSFLFGSKHKLINFVVELC